MPIYGNHIQKPTKILLICKIRAGYMYALWESILLSNFILLIPNQDKEIVDVLIKQLFMKVK